jgi:formate dehydrogenase gamma subunit
VASFDDLKQRARALERQRELSLSLALYRTMLARVEGTPGLAPEPALYVKVGDLCSKLEDGAGAIVMYERAAEHYARQGSAKSVIALCLKIERFDEARTDSNLRFARQLLAHGHEMAAVEVLTNFAERAGLTSLQAWLSRLSGWSGSGRRAALEQLLTGLEQRANRSMAADASRSRAGDGHARNPASPAQGGVDPPAPRDIEITPGTTSQTRRMKRKVLPRRVLRFRAAERQIHWAIAIPVTVCLLSAAVLVLVYNADRERPFRDVFSWIHRISAICMITLPAVAVIRNLDDLKVHLDNVKQAWSWTFDDLKWLFLMGFAAVSTRVRLPAVGKFNAAQKLNFMSTMTTYPLFIVTGVMIWREGASVYSWLAHVSLAAVVTPLLLGHVYMAAFNPSSRAALKGMITGYVDRWWLRHHHARWYQEHFEDKRGLELVRGNLASHPLQLPARVLCPSCNATLTATSWASLLRRLLQADPLVCPRCRTKVGIAAATPPPPDLVNAILGHLEQGAAHEPLSIKLGGPDRSPLDPVVQYEAVG